MQDVILQERELHYPAYDVRIAGRPVPPPLLSDIVEVTYRDAVDGLDVVELVVNNWDNDAGSFKYQDTADFDPPQPLDLDMGYYGALRRMIAAEIVTLESHMRGPGHVALHVRGLNRLHQLRTTQQTHVYEDKTDTQIAREIAGRLGVDLAGDPSAQAGEVSHPYLLQANEYDIVFLLSRARRIGYELWLKEGTGGQRTLHFGPSPAVPVAPLTLEWGLGLQETVLTLSTAGETSEVEVRGWDPMRKTPIVERATWSMLDVQGLPDSTVQGAVTRALDGRREVVVDRPARTAMEAKVLARRSLEGVAKDLAVVRATAIGTPSLRAGTKVTLNGLGRRYSGTYFVSRSTHRYGAGGYQTQFVARLEKRR